MYDLSAFPNGLRLVTVAMPHAYSVSVGFYLSIGSRYEEGARAGSAHFIEHMLFKGTARRPTPREIALAVEGLGGDLNASTGREMTNFYARVARDQLPVAADVLADMLRGSLFRPEDVERERQVITEEINETLDVPDELVHMQFQALLWPDHPLAHDVAGTRDTVRGLSGTALRDFMAQGYTPDNTVVTVAGPITHAEVRAVIEPLLADWQGRHMLEAQPARPLAGPVARALHRPVEQCHLLLGTRAMDRFDEDRFALSLLNVILGEGMSSRLFLEIREQMGLAYSVYSYASHLRDTGAFAVYAALDPDMLPAATEAILGQLRRLRAEPLTAEELAMAKAYARGRTLLRLEDSGANAGWVGSQLALSGTILTPDEVLTRLDRVTSADVQRVAQRLFRDDALVLSVVGPVDEDADWAGRLRVE